MGIKGKVIKNINFVIYAHPGLSHWIHIKVPCGIKTKVRTARVQSTYADQHVFVIIEHILFVNSSFCADLSSPNVWSIIIISNEAIHVYAPVSS